MRIIIIISLCFISTFGFSQMQLNQIEASSTQSNVILTKPVSPLGNIQHYVTMTEFSDTLANYFDRYWTKSGNFVYVLTDTIGIGTAAPDEKLVVYDTIPTVKISSANELEGTAGTETVGNIEFEGYKLTNTSVGARIRARQDGTWSTVTQFLSPMALEFFTQDNSGSEITSPRMTISSVGNVGIGVDPTTKLHVNGEFRLDNATEGVDKVLRSDANGLSSWVALSSLTGGTDDQTLTEVLTSGNNAGGLNITNVGDLDVYNLDVDTDLRLLGLSTDNTFDEILVINPLDDVVFKRDLSTIQRTEEEIEDYVGGMLSGNTETGITVTYQDSDGTIDFVATDVSATNELNTGVALVGNDLQVTDAGGTLYTSLAAYLDNTDSQVLDVSQLVGTNLELSLSGDGEATKVIDLSSLDDSGTDDQNIEEVLTEGNDANNLDLVGLANLGIGIDAPTSMLHLYKAASPKITIGNLYGANYIDNNSFSGTSVIRFDHQVTGGTDNAYFNFGQATTTSGATGLRVFDGSAAIQHSLIDGDSYLMGQTGNLGIGVSSPSNKLDVSGQIRMRTGAADGYILVGNSTGVMTWTNPTAYTNTDNQQISNFSITSDILSLEIEDDGQAAQTVDLSPYLDNTDAQDLTLTANTLAISGDPNTDVDLSGYLDNTDNQTLTEVLTEDNDGGDIDIENLGSIGINATPDSEIHILTPSPIIKLQDSNSTIASDDMSTTLWFNDSANANAAIVGFLNSDVFAVDLTTDYKFGVYGTTTTPILYADDSNRYVGINTASPSTDFDVNGTIRMRDGAASGYIPISDANGVMTWTSPTAYTNTDAQTLSFSNPNLSITGGNSVDISGIDTNTNIFNANGTIGSGRTVAVTDNVNFDSNTFVIDGTNNRVGLGTTAPRSLLGLSVAAASNIQTFTSTGLAATIPPSSNFGQFNFYSSDVSGTGAGNVATIKVYQQNNSGFARGQIGFLTANRESDSSPQERMTISAYGLVGIGTTSPSATLDVVGTMELVNSANNTFINTNPSGVTTGDYNIAIGLLALEDMTTADRNIAIGDSNLKDITTGVDNTVIGYNVSTKGIDSDNNVIIGNYSAQYSEGDNNVIIGQQAANNFAESASSATISDNVIIGRQAGYENEGDGNVFIGHEAGKQLTNADNKLVIDNSDTTTPLIDGDFANDILTINDVLKIAPQTATSASSITAANGMIIYVSDTNGTFTSAGFWVYEAGAWRTM